MIVQFLAILGSASAFSSIDYNAKKLDEKAEAEPKNALAKYDQCKNTQLESRNEVFFIKYIKIHKKLYKKIITLGIDCTPSYWACATAIDRA